MKNKRSLLGFGLIALVLFLGVGYAAVSGIDLTINGTASVENSDIKVSFTNVTDNSDDDTTVTNTFQDAGLTANFEITNMTLNETVTLIYTVQNEETDVAASLTGPVGVTNSNEEHFEATYEIVEADVPAQGETTVKVTVTLVKTPVTSEDDDATFSLTLNAAPAQN